ncbi:HpcH/HpaI aldolase/citrate lyase family protein [Chloroflexota bacterium]
MLIKNATKDKLKKDQLVMGFRMEFASSLLVEALGDAGFDFVFIDCEHRNGMSDQDVENMIRVAEMVNLTPIIRVPSNDHAIIANYLEQGAMGIIAPHCINKEVTESLVSAVKYPPQGGRGMGGRAFSQRNMPVGDYVREANQETMAIALIEDAEGVDNLSEIVSVDGIDLIIVGQYDLSSSMGYPGELDHPEVRAAVEKIINMTRAAGKAVAVGPAPVQDPEKLKRLLDMGLRYIDIGLTELIKGAARDIIQKVHAVYDKGK